MSHGTSWRKICEQETPENIFSLTSKTWKEIFQGDFQQLNVSFRPGDRANFCYELVLISQGTSTALLCLLLLVCKGDVGLKPTLETRNCERSRACFCVPECQVAISCRSFTVRFQVTSHDVKIRATGLGSRGRNVARKVARETLVRTVLTRALSREATVSFGKPRQASREPSASIRLPLEETANFIALVPPSSCRIADATFPKQEQGLNLTENSWSFSSGCFVTFKTRSPCRGSSASFSARLPKRWFNFERVKFLPTSCSPASCFSFKITK